MSREFHLLTRERPSQDSLLDALREAMAEITPPEVDGDFENPNAYLNVSSPDLWFEIEPPGHVEAADLEDTYLVELALPEPDDQQCLWLTVANIPAGAPGGSAEVARTVFEDLASRYHGIAFNP